MAELVKVDFVDVEGDLPPASCAVCGDPSQRLAQVYFPPGIKFEGSDGEGARVVIGSCEVDHTAVEYVGAAVMKLQGLKGPLFG